MTAHTSLDPTATAEIIAKLSAANKEFMRRYPGESNRRQAVHTVYGGAQLFKADSARKLGDVTGRVTQAGDYKLIARVWDARGQQISENIFEFRVQ